MRKEKELGFFERVYNATIELGFKKEALEEQYRREIDLKDFKEAWETQYYLFLYAVPTAAVNLWTYLIFIFSPYGQISPGISSQPRVGIALSSLWLVYSGIALLVAYI